MSTLAHEHSLQEVVEALDLSDIAQAMCSKHYPLPRWQAAQAAQCEQLYKNFLWLMVHYPDETLVPTREIDEFWHNHILHTKRYMADCQRLAGRYLHHTPSSPDDSEELARLAPLFARTKALYLKEFGEPLQVLLPKR